jgi:hypothetical protein
MSIFVISCKRWSWTFLMRKEWDSSVNFLAPTTLNPFLEIEDCRRYTCSLSTKHSRRPHVRFGFEMRRLGASKFGNKPRALLRLRLSASNPNPVRGLSHYRRGISRCYSHSQRNTAFLSRRASRLRTRLQWPGLSTWEETVEIGPGCRYRGSGGIPTWSMGYCLFLVSFPQHNFQYLTELPLHI